MDNNKYKGGGVATFVRVMLATLLACFSVNSHAVPSFARQTSLACSACHTVFPELTSFGRNFKLNGYTMVGTPQVSQEAGVGSGGVSVDMGTPLSAMVQIGMTHLAKAEDGTQNNDVQFPQQISLFYAGRFSEEMGAFAQLTYDQPSATTGIDNVDIRYARSITLADKPVTYGVTVNNNPTVQDLWNSLPAWGYPFVASGSAPAPAASPIIGRLGQDVAGIGAYTLWNNLVYAELSFYRSSHQGQVKPDTTTDNIQGSSPYARLAWQYGADNGDNLMLGLTGMRVNYYRAATGGVTGPVDTFEDRVVDAQYEHPIHQNSLVLHASFTHEGQTLNASDLFTGATGFNPTLKTAKVDGSYHYGNRATATLAYWNTKGDSGDYSLVYGDGTAGSYVGSPDNRGWIAELAYLPWQNTKFTLQYTAYNKFDALPAGRKAADNNTTFLQAWLVW
ncbi:MAG TPA: hypothetical protein VFM34_10330 [Moraxellaceae bacterium]|nr:hypothetical protein [Moraxellaceae bacterium]